MKRTHASLDESGEHLASAFDEFLEQYTTHQFASGVVTPKGDRVAVHPSMPQLVWGAVAVLIEFLKRAPAGMKTREFLARWVGCCPVGVGFKEKFEAYARSIRTRYPGGTMDNSCDCMAQILAEGLSEALRTGYDSLGRHQGAFHFPPKQRLLLKALHRKGPVPERRLLERVYPLGQRRARQPVLKARLRKLLYDTNENLLSLGLSRVERKMHRRTDSLLLWPHEGPIP